MTATTTPKVSDTVHAVAGMGAKTANSAVPTAMPTEVKNVAR